MTREKLTIILLFFILGCAILVAITDLELAIRRLKIYVAFPNASGSVIEGEAKPVETEEPAK